MGGGDVVMKRAGWAKSLDFEKGEEKEKKCCEEMNREGCL